MNEMGVVLLFGRLASTLGFTVEVVRREYPDCVAVRGGERLAVEFEFWASDFETHRHDPRKADVVVCWEDDWSDRPKRYRHLEIISLKSYVGAQPRVFCVGCVESHSGEELKHARVSWNVPVSAQRGDIVLIYRTAPTSAIRDLWRIEGPIKRYGKRNREGYWPGLQAGLKKLCTLDRPLAFADLRSDPRTSNLPIVRKRFQGKVDLTNEWPLFVALIIERNPRLRKLLTSLLPS